MDEKGWESDFTILHDMKWKKFDGCLDFVAGTTQIGCLDKKWEWPFITSNDQSPEAGIISLVSHDQGFQKVM